LVFGGDRYFISQSKKHNKNTIEKVRNSKAPAICPRKTIVWSIHLPLEEPYSVFSGPELACLDHLWYLDVQLCPVFRWVMMIDELV
jgi:hypothetical protein